MSLHPQQGIYGQQYNCELNLCDYRIESQSRLDLKVHNRVQDLRLTMRHSKEFMKAHPLGLTKRNISIRYGDRWLTHRKRKCGSLRS